MISSRSFIIICFRFSSMGERKAIIDLNLTFGHVCSGILRSLDLAASFEDKNIAFSQSQAVVFLDHWRYCADKLSNACLITSLEGNFL